MLPPAPILVAQGNSIVQKRPPGTTDTDKRKKRRTTLTGNEDLVQLSQEDLINEVLKLRKENLDLTASLNDFKSSSKNNLVLVTLWEENQYMKECLATHRILLPVPNLKSANDGWDYYSRLKEQVGEYDSLFPFRKQDHEINEIR